jgi:O-antigen biosynthesis protein WbqP
MQAMKRTFDLFASLSLAVLLAIPMLVIAAGIKLTSAGPVLHWSNRVGRNNKLFRMPKFRTMRVGTPQLATHLLTGAEQWITPFGRFLRSTSLDELPQLWSILVGDMSFVGPRPALFNQDDLVELRTAAGIHRLTPGLTGWAQVNGRDELPIPEKVHLETHYLRHQSLRFDLWILALTAIKVVRREGIAQAGETAASEPAQSAYADTLDRR